MYIHRIPPVIFHEPTHAIPVAYSASQKAQVWWRARDHILLLSFDAFTTFRNSPY